MNYLYDGDGRRVAKVGSKLYWYGSGDDILAETDASGNTQNEYIFFGGKRIAILPAGGNPTYYVEDMLGSSRVLTTNAGVVCYDADFYPYGGERSDTNTCPQNYKFEGKERDAETGNDDFGARYYSNRFGRWLSADWSSVPAPVPYANLSNPQTLNLYTMVADDPDSFADSDGHGDASGGFCDEHRCYSRPADDRNSVTARQAIAQTLGIGALTAAVLAAPEALGSALLRNLMGWGLATAPVTGPIIADALEALTPGAPGSLTISSSTRLTATEISTGVRLAQQTGEALVQSEHVGAEFVSASGKTYDAMGGGKAFEHFGDGSNFMKSIVGHLNKSVDKIAIDLQGASKAQVGAIKDFVKTLTKAQQKKIVYVKPS